MPFSPTSACPASADSRLLKALHARTPDLPVIIMTAHTDLESAVASYRGGAFEYLPKPFDVDEAVRLVRRAIEYRRRQKPAAPAETAHRPRRSSVKRPRCRKSSAPSAGCRIPT